MMELTIVCPLCSQLGFTDVNSLWLNLVRATSRHLACPVCQDVLCGLDKLTIHLVGHCLQYQTTESCPSSCVSSPQSVLPSGIEVHRGSHGPMSLHPQALQTLVNEVKESSPVASFVLLNFSNLQDIAIDGSCQLPMAGRNYTNEHLTHSSISLDASLPVLQTPSTIAPTTNTTSLAMAPTSVSNGKSSVQFDCLSHSSRKSESGISERSSFIKTEERSNLSENLTSVDHRLNQIRVPKLTSFEKPPKMSQILAHSVSSKVDSNTESTPDNFGSETAVLASCGSCGVTFKDNNIAILHQQLVHSQTSSEQSKYQQVSKIDGNCSSHKQSPSRSKRGSFSSQSRNAASPLHRFPCFVCNKVFRMRGSLMVHMRVAHSSYEGGTLASNLVGSASASVSQLGFDSCKLSMQNLSIKEASGSNSPGRELSMTNSAEIMMNGQILYCKDLSGTPESPSNTGKSSLDVAYSVSSESEVKRNDSSTLKMPAPSASPPLKSPNQSPITHTAPVDCVGMVFPCSLCNKTYSKESLLTQHLKSHDNKQWECDVCLKGFTTKYFLKKHKRLHTGEMPYTCGICNKSFTFQQSYHKHLLYHSDEKPHSCSECGRAFKELSTLHNHQRIHTGEKPWACETCGKCFRQRVSYLVHRRIHTGAMPYQCMVCMKSFRYKVSQRTHKCAAQPTASSSTELLQQLLLSPNQEEESKVDLPSTSSIGLHDSPQMLSKELQHFHQNTSLSVCLPGENPLQRGAHPLCSSPQGRDYNDFISSCPSESDAVLKEIPPTSNSGLDLNEGKHFVTVQEHSRIDSIHTSTQLPECTHPSSANDFNVDLFQDILSMVMSASPDNTPSPSSQLRHLSLSGGQNDDDFESGLELRQLLYGPNDSEST